MSRARRIARRVIPRPAATNEQPVPDIPGTTVLGDMDAPRPGAVVERERILAGGWAVDVDEPIRHVEVHVNGVIFETVPMRPNRPEITEAFPDHASERPGWTTWLDLGTVYASEIVVEAVAVRENGERIVIASAPCEVAGDAQSVPDLRAARWLTEKDTLPEGFARMYGVATCPGGVSRVDVRVDARDIGPARVALPGSYDFIDHPEDHISAFEVVHDFRPSDSGPSRVEATITGIDGVTFEMEVKEITVVPAAAADRARDAELVERTAARTLAAQVPNDVPGQVLVFTHDLSLGGGQLYLQELLVQLGARGMRFVVVSPRDGVLREALEAAGHEVHVTGDFPVGDADAYEGRMQEFLAWAAQRDCVAAIGNTMLVFPGIDAAQRMGLRTAWAIHESFDLDQFWLEAFPPGTVSMHARERAQVALRGTDRAVFEADATRQQYAPHLSEGAGEVVPYGVDVAGIDAYRAAHDREQTRAALDIEPDELVLLCLGTIEPRKAQIMLAQAFAHAPDQHVRLVFVGARPGSYLDTLTNYVFYSGEERVRIEPIVADTYQWYLAADVLVCASDIESLPRSIIEAMLFECPVASTSVFGIPELITDGEHGWLCAHRDVRALADCLARVVATPRDELRRMGAAAHALAAERHAPHIYVDFFAGEVERLTLQPASVPG